MRKSTHLKIEVNLLVAKIGVMFSREPIRGPTPKDRVRKAQRIALEEYRGIHADAPKDFHPFIAKEVMPNRNPSR